MAPCGGGGKASLSAEETRARALRELQSERKRERSKLQGEKSQLDGSKTNFTTRGVNHGDRLSTEIVGDTRKMGLF